MADRPRVLLLTPDFPPASGGIQLLLHRLATHLNCPVRVVTLAERGGAGGDGPEASVHRVRSVPTGSHRLEVAALNYSAVVQAMRYRPDVVLNGHIVASPAAAAIARLLRVPYVQYVHAAELLLRRRLARMAVGGAAAVVAVSAYSAALAKAAGADAARVRIIPPGVDIPGAPLARRDPTPLVVTVARLSDLYKGHDVVLRAAPLVAAEVPGARWAIVGGGPLEGRYRAAAIAVGAADHVQFTGAVNTEERDRWLDRAHVFALPSRAGPSGGEGFGIVYLEAALHGLPAVAGNVGGARDAVVGDATGLLVDPTDHVAVASAVTQLFATPGLPPA